MRRKRKLTLVKCILAGNVLTDTDINLGGEKGQYPINAVQYNNQDNLSTEKKGSNWMQTLISTKLCHLKRQFTYDAHVII